MRYMGGKSRLAKSIRDVILSHVEVGKNTTYWEPFVGGCGAFEVIAPKFPRAIGSDIHRDLIMMWQEGMRVWSPPSTVSEQQYQSMRRAEPSALRGFVGFGCSFGGKWFGGFARGGNNSDGTPRDHTAESSRNVSKTLEILRPLEAEFKCIPYWDITPKEGDVVYCDPPYEGTTEYRDSGFDSSRFWEWATNLSKQGVKVFVSEYKAPVGWKEVYRREVLSSVSRAEDREMAVDKLFKYCGEIGG